MKVGIVLGSRWQWSTIQHTGNLLAHLGIAYEARIITANKSSNRLHEYASKAVDRGIEIIIAGSSGTTNLREILSSKTKVPVLGIQVNTSTRSAKSSDSKSDSNSSSPIRILNSGPGGAVNTALFAASILACKYPRIYKNLVNYRTQKECEKVSKVISRCMA